MTRGASGCCLIALEFNKQLPGMKRDASVYLYNESQCAGNSKLEKRKRVDSRGKLYESKPRDEAEERKWVKTRERKGEKRLCSPRWEMGETTPRYTVFPINYVWSARFVQRSDRNSKNPLFVKFSSLM